MRPSVRKNRQPIQNVLDFGPHYEIGNAAGGSLARPEEVIEVAKYCPRRGTWVGSESSLDDILHLRGLFDPLGPCVFPPLRRVVFVQHRLEVIHEQGEYLAIYPHIHFQAVAREEGGISIP